MPVPQAPQYHTGHELAISPGDTNAHALFATASPASAALSFTVIPLTGNNGGATVGQANPPLGPIGLGWAPFVSGRYYNLAEVYFQLEDAGDGVVVQWIT